MMILQLLLNIGFCYEENGDIMLYSKVVPTELSHGWFAFTGQYKFIPLYF